MLQRKTMVMAGNLLWRQACQLHKLKIVLFEFWIMFNSILLWK